MIDYVFYTQPDALTSYIYIKYSKKYVPQFVTWDKLRQRWCHKHRRELVKLNDVNSIILNDIINSGWYVGSATYRHTHFFGESWLDIQIVKRRRYIKISLSPDTIKLTCYRYYYINGLKASYTKVVKLSDYQNITAYF
jgi:hypothetical protein